MSEDLTKTKLERTTIDYGGGGGSTFFESELFRVVHWRHGSGLKRTVLEIKLVDKVYLDFDGHCKLDSDEACFNQLELKEIIAIVEYQKAKAFEAGKVSKAQEIRNALNCY